MPKEKTLVLRKTHSKFWKLYVSASSELKTTDQELFRCQRPQQTIIRSPLSKHNSIISQYSTFNWPRGRSSVLITIFIYFFIIIYLFSTDGFECWWSSFKKEKSKDIILSCIFFAKSHFGCDVFYEKVPKLKLKSSFPKRA